MKRIINYIVIASFLYSNSVYSFPEKPFQMDKLAAVNSFNPKFVQALQNLDSLFDTVGEKDIREVVNELRDLFSRFLDDEPNGLSIFCNRAMGEFFIFSRKWIVQIYKDRYTEVPVEPNQKYNVGGRNINIYPFSEEIIRVLGKIEDMVLVEGLPQLRFTPEELDEIITKHVNGIRDTGTGLILGSSLDAYIAMLLSKKRPTPQKEITSAYYAQIQEGLKDSSGNEVFGWLWVNGIKGLENYIEGDPEENRRLEAINALRIRNYIVSSGRRLIPSQSLISEYPWLDIKVWDDVKGNNKDLNEIIARNVELLFSKLPDEEKGELLRNLKEVNSQGPIAISILDRSRHWCENCRGDRFIGLSRYLLEKIRDTLIALSDELKGGNREDVKTGLENKLLALETYLQTYLYHELRHEAFLGERRLLSDLAYEVEGLGKGINIEGMDTLDLEDLIKKLNRDVRDKLEGELERRQNGYDAQFFVGICGKKYEEFLKTLIELKILDMDSKFLHAVAISSFSLEVPINQIGHKHYSELIIKDFSKLPKGRLARMVYDKYDTKYSKMYKSDEEGTKFLFRDRVAYLLYCIGLTDQISIDTWREENDYDRELAKKHIIRLIDFMSRHERYIKYEPGRGEVSMFRKRERPLSYWDSAQLLMVSLLGSGDYSQAILRTELAFKTSGIVNTVTRNKFEFWKLVEESCIEMVKKGDKRFIGITAEAMRTASIEKEMMPRLRILYSFKDYLNNLSGTRFQKGYRDTLSSLCIKHNLYKKMNKVTFESEDINSFDKLYKKACMILSSVFGMDGDEWKDIFNTEEDDLLLTLWDTFDFVENLVGDLNYRFTEPLFVTGISGDETRFTKEELEDIKVLKGIFDIERIGIKDVYSEDTKRRVQTILRIYRRKVLKYREGLCDILNRYGTDRDIYGNRTWELMRTTRGWASAIWVAREYGKLFKDGVIKKSLDIDSGLSVFYRALLKFDGAMEKKLSGLTDVISDTGAEYFGDNTNRMTGNLVDYNLKDMRTGNSITPQDESHQLITSIYRLHTIDSPRKIYRIFENVHRLLEYGGHFVITLPFGRAFTQEGLDALREKMGFEPIVPPGVTWNELSDEAKKRIKDTLGQEEVKRLIRELKKKRFYVIVLKKVGAIKKGAEEIQDKSLLLPKVLSEKEMREPIVPDEIIPEEDVEVEEPKETMPFMPDEGDWTCAGVLDGIDFSTGKMASGLLGGLSESTSLKEKAENVGIISEYQKLIRELSKKLNDYIGGDLRSRIDNALGYEDSNYTSAIEDELFELWEYLEKLKNFIEGNYKEFSEKLDWIKTKGNLASMLKSEDKIIFDRLTKLKETDINEKNLIDVRYVYEKLLDIEQVLKRKDEEELALDKFRNEKWEEFNKLQGLITKYRVIGEYFKMKKDIQTIIDTRKENLTPRLMKLAIEIDERIVNRFSLGKRVFNNLMELEDGLRDLFIWVECEFLFTFYDTRFLSRMKDEWEKEELSKGCLEFITSDAIMHLHSCIGIVSDWEDLKEMINWDIGLAGLLKEKQESEYVDTLDRGLLYKPFSDTSRVKGNIVNIPIGISGEQIKQILVTNYNNIQIGEDLIIGIDDCFGITNDFLIGLEEMGFEVRSLYEVWLEINADPEIKRFMRRGKRVIIVKKKGEPIDVSAIWFNLAIVREERQDYSKWMDTRHKILQELDPSNFSISIRELLSKAQVMSEYPDWASEFLGKGEWTGDFFDREIIETNVNAYREKIEEEERAREEREANLIKRATGPIVGITYEGIWTESLVRDLAQILLKIISDFNNLPELSTLLDDPYIASHPRLKDIPMDELLAKVKELVRYRQYDLRIERLYREIIRFMGVLLQGSAHRLNVKIKIDGMEKRVGLLNVHDVDKILRWHEYRLGYDSSVFGEDLEEWHDDIIGFFFALRQFSPVEFYEDYQFKGRGLVIHCLTDPERVFKRFSGKVKGVEIVTGRESLKFEKEVLEKLINKYGKKNPKISETLMRLNRVYNKVIEVITLLSNVYQNKNFNEKYLDGLMGLMDSLFLYFMKKTELNKLDFAEFVKIMESVVNNFEKLLNGEMTVQEYAAFIKGINQRLTIEGQTSLQEVSDELDTVHKLYYYYMYGEGQEVKVPISEEDEIISKYADEQVKVKYYYDVLKLLKSTRLYNISDEEKRVLEELVNEILSAPDSSLLKMTREQLIAYLKASNTINRYLYFSFIYLSRVWRHPNLDQALKEGEDILKGILDIEPKLLVYTLDKDKLNVITLIAELYRLKQMIEDISLKDAGMEIQLAIIDLVTMIRDKLKDPNLLRELDKMTGEMLYNEYLRYELATIGNPYHIDLIQNVVIGLNYLQQIDENDVQRHLEGELDENSRKIVESIIQELQILFMYFPYEKDVALKNAARGLAKRIVHAGENEGTRLFMKLFSKYMPMEYKRFNELVNEVKKDVKKEISLTELVRLLGAAIRSITEYEDLPKEVLNMIKTHQGFRSMLLININKIKTEYRESRNPEGWKNLVKLIFQHVENPYEIYHLYKVLTTLSASEIQQAHVCREIINESVEKMEGFINSEWKDKVTDILTRAYNQFFTMRDFICLGLDSSEGFRRYLAEIFSKGDGIVSSYAYHYIKWQKIDRPSEKERIGIMHELFQYLIDGLLRNGDNLEGIKLRRVLELFAFVVNTEGNFTLQNEWEYIIGGYRKGDISKGTLLAIERNAKWMMEDICSELPMERKQDIKSRFGLDIFEKAVGEEDSAYFGKMKQSEINPQIKRILEDPSEKDFCFISGRSEEGKKGKLKVEEKCKIIRDNPHISGYGIVVLRGVNFSGHFSSKRGGRIYIPYEMLEAFNLQPSVFSALLEDFIEHEHLHTQGWGEDRIIRNSKKKRPGIYERARELYRKYIAERLFELLGEIEGAEILKTKIERILKRVQDGKRIELTEIQLHRLLWLIQRSKGLNLAPEIARLIDLILEPNYIGDPGMVIAEIEKTILAHIYTEEQLARQKVLEKTTEIEETEREKLLVVRRTHTGLRFEGPKLSPEVKNAIQYVYDFKVKEPARVEGDHYVLIDEFRAEGYKKVIKEVSERLGVFFVTKVPEGVDPKDVVVLVDPEDTDRAKWVNEGFELYLPVIYDEKSFIFAAELSIKQPKTDGEIKKTQAYIFLKGFYEALLGSELEDSNVISWFRRPWYIMDEIKCLTSELRIIRIAVEQLSKSA